MTSQFSGLGLSDALVRAISDSGYTEPTAIQTQAIPVVLEGRDVLAGAQTGTGKTAAFTLPLLQRLSQKPATGRRVIRALVLTPTRELAAQVEQSIKTYGRHMPLTSTVVYGGMSINPQINTLRRGVDILVATPGRLLDHVQQKTVDLKHVEVLVLDEADRMLDMGFIPDIRRILSLVPAQRQSLLFSATFSKEIRDLAHGMLRDPVTVQVARQNAESHLVTQRYYTVAQTAKRDLLAHLVSTGDWKQVLVFTRTKHGANRLADQLSRKGIQSSAIHGNKSQGARTKALAAFKEGTMRVLVATDIAARGLDIVELPHVVNFDLPHVAEDYVHRIGRTGRAGSTGEAISLVAPDERNLLSAIERLIGRKIDREVAPGVVILPDALTFAPQEPDLEQRPQQRRQGQGRGQGQGQGQGRGRSGQQPRREAAGEGRQPKRNESQAGARRGDHPRKPAGPKTHEHRSERGPRDAQGHDDNRGNRMAPARQNAGGEERQPASSGNQMFPSSGKVFGDPSRRNRGGNRPPEKRVTNPNGPAWRSLGVTRRYEDEL